MKIISESEFNDEIKEGLVLVDFFADWCRPCKMFIPILEEIDNENNNIKVVKVNVDEAKKLAYYFEIQSIPTLLLIKDGEEKQRIIGFTTKEKVMEMVKQIK